MKRPVYVTVVGVILILTGIVEAAIGALVFAARNDQTALDKADISTSHATVLSVILVILGLVSIGLAFGLLRGSRAARGVFAFITAGQMAGGIYSAITLSADHRAASIGAVVGSIVSIYFMFGSASSKEFFKDA